MIKVHRHAFNELLMTATGVDEVTRVKHKLHATYALGPELCFYSETEHRWLTNSEWEWCHASSNSK